MSAPRRSERLAPKLFVANMRQFNKVQEQIIQMPSHQQFSPVEKIKMVVNLVKLVNSNYEIIKQWGGKKYDIFFNMLYKKSFSWIQETIKLCAKRAPAMIAIFKKFRKKHETTRYASWEFLRNQFRLDANIMFCIDSYM